MNQCTGCGKESIHDVCMGCVMARHKAVMKKKCGCKKAERRERQVSTGSRKWVACDRCLGPVRQVS